MSLETVLLPLAAIWVVAVVTPGPNFFACLHMAIGHGRAAGLATVAGIVAGTALWAAAGLFGLKALFAAFPWAAFAIKLVGGIYLIVVGIQLWRSAARPAAANIANPRRRGFVFGLYTVLANPKTAAVAASLFAVALPPDAGPTLAVAALALIVAIPALWYALVVIACGRKPVIDAYARARAVLLRVTGALFAGFGVKLVLER